LEKRVDTAVFRAMFASSISQARQFVVRGKVKVNGKKVTQPNTRLRPGDMFHVDPESVLTAVGRTKPPATQAIVRRPTKISENLEPAAQKSESSLHAEQSIEPGERSETLIESITSSSASPPDPSIATTPAVTSEEAEATSKTAETGSENNPEQWVLGRKDPDRPYWTPWRPRPFLSPWAFLPAYLEVSHLTCSAVYLRDPVARAGRSEIPTPFRPDLYDLAYNYYTRRYRR